MMEKVAGLEAQLAGISDRTALEDRIVELEAALEEMERQQRESSATTSHWSLQILKFLIIPLTILLLGHGLITIVYDLPLLALRLLSIVVPLPFAYFLFAERRRPLAPWFLGTIILAAGAVVGMSGITALVDNTPVFPQSSIEWKEFIEYAASISFSFLTGMLLGNLAYQRRHRPKTKDGVSPWAALLAAGLGDGKLSPETVQKLMRKINEFGGTAVALGSTAMSIYTGLKGVL
ncbi:MAG: hypothetical protein FGM18_04225 [Burkholderiaceae bacterium]|nr:hypothetical protein [Burkholderiaceae bacterium]